MSVWDSGLSSTPTLWYPKVRIGKRRVVVPVLVTLGVREDGERVILDMRMAGEESGASWTEVLASLVRRKMATPVLAIIDGNPGLHAALQQQWPSIAVQRCTAHKLRNLTAKAPARSPVLRYLERPVRDGGNASRVGRPHHHLAPLRGDVKEKSVGIARVYSRW
jgi:hypothetical protein